MTAATATAWDPATRETLHKLELDGHAWDANATTARGVRKFIAAVNAAIKDAVGAAAALRGYTAMSDAVGAAAVGAPIVRAMSDAAERVAWSYYLSGDIAAAALERVAQYMDGGACERCLEDTAHLSAHVDATARIVDATATGYGRSLAARIAHQLCRNASTGRGAMAMFTRTDTEIETAIVEHLRGRLVGPIAAFTVAALKCGNCIVGRGCRWHNGRLPRRAMTAAERRGVLRAYRVERVERAPLYAPLLDGHGDALPTARSGHGVGHVAPGLPTRDAASLRRGTVGERLVAAGAPSYIRSTVARIHDAANLPDTDGRYRKTAPWDAIVESGIGTLSADSLRRHTRQWLESIAAAELGERDAPLPPRPPTVTVARATGRPRPRPPTGRHWSDLRGVAIESPPPSTGSATAWRERPLWTPNACECNTEVAAVHIRGCAVRAERVRRIAAVGSATTRDAYLTAVNA